MRPTDALPHPADWHTTTVSRSVEVKRGVSWSKEQEHSEPGLDRVPVIGIRNVQDRLDLTDLLYLSGLKPAAVDKARVSAGWTVIVGSNGNRARIGNAVLVRENAAFLFASFLIGAKPKADSGLSSDYFYRWLSTEQVQAYLSASSEGTTGLNNLSHSFFKAMSIPVPAPDEQAAIARLLDAVDTALERTRAAVERARDLRRALMQELLPPWIGLRELTGSQKPAGVEEIVRADVVTDVCNGSTPSRLEGRYWRQGTIPWLRTGKVHDRIITAADEFVTEAALRECSIRLLPRGTALVGMIGQGRTRGMSAYLDVEACINQNFGAFTPRPAPTLRVCGKWLFYFFDFHYSRVREVGGGTNQGALNCYLLKRLRLPLPALDRQKEVAAVLEGVESLEKARLTVLIVWGHLKNSLMHDLITGRTRVASAIKAAAS